MRMGMVRASGDGDVERGRKRRSKIKRMHSEGEAGKKGDEEEGGKD